MDELAVDRGGATLNVHAAGVMAEPVRHILEAQQPQPGDGEQKHQHAAEAGENFAFDVHVGEARSKCGHM